MKVQVNAQKELTRNDHIAPSTAAEKDAHRYDDIINLPHHVSKTHPQMPLADRAAQFAPFAALTGHADAIRETERIVEERVAHETDGEAEESNFDWFFASEP